MARFFGGGGGANADEIIAQITDSAPETLDTLNELAAALGNDANFAATVTSTLSSKADTSYVDSAVATKADTSYVDSAVATKADSNHTHNMSQIATTVSSKASAYTILATDKNTFISSTSGTAVNMTIANVLNVGESVQFIQLGAGQITFVAGAGVTLLSVDNKLKTNKQYSVAAITCVASGQYLITGDLAA